MVISEVQALCGSGDCPVLFFNPSMADGGLAEAQLLNLDWAVPASAEELRARMPNPRPLDPEGPA